MIFGRKKKHQHGGNPDDYTSDGEGSVPPPPPGMTTNTDIFYDERGSPNVNSLNNANRYPSGEEGEENGISFLTDADDLKKENNQDSHRLKKFFLIFLFIATLAVLIGLTIEYAHRQSSESNVATLEAGPSSEENFSVAGPPVPSQSATVLSTEAPTEAGTEEGTDEPTLAPTEEGESEEQNEVVFTFEYDCVDHQIFASSQCKAGVTSATIVFCMKGTIRNKYWSWIEYPKAFEDSAADDWGWLSEGMTIHRTNIPPGTYKIGLYGKNDQQVTSTTFNVLCSL
jgi:hypothetical protein